MTDEQIFENEIKCITRRFELFKKDYMKHLKMTFAVTEKGKMRNDR